MRLRVVCADGEARVAARVSDAHVQRRQLVRTAEAIASCASSARVHGCMHVHAAV